MRKTRHTGRRAFACRGQSLVETSLALGLLCIVFFGLTQLVYLYTARMVSNHAAYVTARSRVVGFEDAVVRRAGEVGTIPMAGRLVWPENMTNLGAVAQGSREPQLIQQFMESPGYIIYYEYWSSGWRDPGDRANYNTSIGIDLPLVDGGMAEVGVDVRNYPVDLPLSSLFSDRDSVSFRTSAEMYDHADYYLR